MTSNPVDIVFQIISENPGIKRSGLKDKSGYNYELMDDIVLALKLQNKITFVGSKIYNLTDFPDIAPDTSIILKEIKSKPQTGMSYETLIERTRYPREVIIQELDFLRKQKRIYELDDRFYPVPIPDPHINHPLLNSLDFLTREELIALVRLLVQQHNWMDESLKDAAKLVNSRRKPYKIELPKEEEDFTNAGGQFANIKPDGSINLKF